MRKIMNKLTSIVVVLVIFIGFTIPVFAQLAGGTGNRMSWSDFISSYDQITKTGGKMALTGNLKITQNVQFSQTANPITIDCSRYGITIAQGCEVTINNTNLTFTGNSSPLGVLILMGKLNLNACNIHVTNTNAILLSQNPNLNMDKASNVNITATYDEEHSGVPPVWATVADPVALKLNHMNIIANGCETAVQVFSDVEIKNSTISVLGDFVQCAVRAENCIITQDDASVLTPPLTPTDTDRDYTYDVTYAHSPEMVRFLHGIRKTELTLPQTIEIHRQNPLDTGQVIPDTNADVKWDLSLLPDTLTEGNYTVKGTLSEEFLHSIDTQNPKNITVSCPISVVKRQPITDLKATAFFNDSLNHVTLVVVLPRLDEATALYAEYSHDGLTWKRLQGNEYYPTNLLQMDKNLYDTPQGYQFRVPLPFMATEFYTRVVIEGSVFEGVSNAVKINKANPPDIELGDIDGDRGGGGQDTPTRKPLDDIPALNPVDTLSNENPAITQSDDTFSKKNECTNTPSKDEVAQSESAAADPTVNPSNPRNNALSATFIIIILVLCIVISAGIVYRVNYKNRPSK